MTTNRSKDSTRLEKAIRGRAERRGLHVDLDRIRYANQCLFSAIPVKNREAVLYVGVGHGHDALLALLDGLVSTVVGVDPYVDSAGNADADYQGLLSLIDSYNLKDRFTLERSTIEQFLNHTAVRFDLAVIKDVLHHMFATEGRLSRSDCFPGVVALFRNLVAASHREAMLVVSDVQRRGVRPSLSTLGVLKGSVNYRTKQSWKEWNKAITRAQWALINVQNYVPFRFRKQRWLWSGAWGRHTLCTRYFLAYSRVGTCEEVR